MPTDLRSQGHIKDIAQCLYYPYQIKLWGKCLFIRKELEVLANTSEKYVVVFYCVRVIK